MADKLKPGDLDPFPSALAASMAEAMESALNNLLPKVDKPTVAVDNSDEARDRRVMFLAIAQGIVNHLVQNQAAFKILDVNNNTVGLHIQIGHEP
jgi:hypothetical protein